MAASVGITVAFAMNVGGQHNTTSIYEGTNKLDKIMETIQNNNITLVNPVIDLIRNLFPTNIVLASLSQTQTMIVSSERMKDMVLHNNRHWFMIGMD